MFIYAYARSNYEQNKIPYCLSYMGNLSYFKLTPEDRFFNFLKRLYFKFFIKNKSDIIFLNVDDCWEDHTTIKFDYNKNYIVSGYFQGEMYFKNISNKIPKLFDIKKRYKVEFDKIRKHVDGTYTAVHIRRGDYSYVKGSERFGGPVLTLPDSYYKKAILKYHNNDKIVFISDEINNIKNWFQDIKNSYFKSNSEIIDFQIILNSKTCIISNSTFSWWAAWLNQNPNKIIVAPEYFLGFKIKKEFPLNIIPLNWIKQEV